MEKNHDVFRARAAECSARAAAATDPRTKEFNQTEAETWLRLAEVIEKRNQKPPA
jgi:hypothetical protein